MSAIAALAGRYDEALNWLKRGNTVNEDDMEVVTSLGGLFQSLPVSGYLGRVQGSASSLALASTQHHGEAKKCFERVLVKVTLKNFSHNLYSESV